MRKCEVCSITDKDTKIINLEYSRLLCLRHYSQIKRYGKILKRTKYDPNEIVCKNGICRMKLYGVFGEEKAETIFNEKYLKKISSRKWCLHNMGYVEHAQTHLLLHQLIKGKISGYDIDHIDGDKLNNLDDNLRHITHQQNCWNKKIKGVYFDKSRNKWIAHISVNYKDVWLGRFDVESDALKKRAKAEKKYFGKFAYNA